MLVSGCAMLAPKKPDNPYVGLTILNSSVEYVGPQNIFLEKDRYPQDVVLVFPYVSGSIFGNPDSPSLFIKQMGETMDFSLNLAAKAKEIEPHAQPLTKQWQSLGLSIQPQGALLARLGTFPLSAKTQKFIGGGGFIDSTSRNSLILVYVDRACEIKGQVNLAGERYGHNLKFSGKGFHWVEVLKKSKGVYSLEPYSGHRAKFSIHINDLILL